MTRGGLYWVILPAGCNSPYYFIALHFTLYYHLSMQGLICAYREMFVMPLFVLNASKKTCIILCSTLMVIAKNRSWFIILGNGDDSCLY